MILARLPLPVCAALLCCWFACGGWGAAEAQAQAPAQHLPWTPEAVMEPLKGVGGAELPQKTSWSPDGRLFSFVDAKGALVAEDAATGERTDLLGARELARAATRPVNDKDGDHRARYGQPDYFWSPDGKRLVWDEDGMLWLLTLAGRSWKQVGDTEVGSGDDVQWSPDGQSLSYLRGGDVWVQRVGSEAAAAPVRVTSDGSPTRLNGGVDWVYLEELESRTNYAWAPDSKHLAYLQSDESAVPEFPLVDWMPTLATVDRQRYPQPGTPNPAVRVGVVPAGGGVTEWLALPVRAGEDYVPRLGWVDAHTVWAEVLRRDQKHREIVFADTATGEVRRVFAEDDPKFLDDKYDVEFAGASFVVQSWRDGCVHLYRYAFDAQHPLAGEAKLEGELERGAYEVENVLSVVLGGGAGGGTVFYASTEPADGHPDDARHTTVWAVGLDGTNKRLVAGADGRKHRAEFAPGHASYTDMSQAGSSLPELRLCGGPEGKACRELWRAAPDTDHGWSTPVQLELTAADGVTRLYGFLTLPPGAAAAGAAKATVPLINNPYGGPGAHTEDTWGNKLNQLLAEHGFAVLTVDNRGSDGRSRAFEQAAWHDFGAVQLADQIAAIDQVLARYPQLDGQRLGWWGWSWGGTFTLNALEHSGRFRAGAAVAPVTDFRLYDSIYTERYLGLPAEQKAVYDAAAVQGAAAKLRGRLVLFHGTGDDNVHIGNTVEYVQKLIDAGLPYDLQIFPRKTHAIGGVTARTELYRRLLAHFEMYLKPVAVQ